MTTMSQEYTDLIAVAMDWLTCALDTNVQVQCTSTRILDVYSTYTFIRRYIYTRTTYVHTYIRTYAHRYIRTCVHRGHTDIRTDRHDHVISYHTISYHAIHTYRYVLVTLTCRCLCPFVLVIALSLHVLSPLFTHPLIIIIIMNIISIIVTIIMNSIISGIIIIMIIISSSSSGSISTL